MRKMNEQYNQIIYKVKIGKNKHLGSDQLKKVIERTNFPKEINKSYF